jgi:hypothetical protein
MARLTMAGHDVCYAQFATPPDEGESQLMEKPWIFGHGGVDSDPGQAGTIAAITTEGVDGCSTMLSPP